MGPSWEMHKETIRELYLRQDMTRDQVMMEMEKEYSFKATAGQFDRQFKNWKFRKNLPANEWKFVARRVEKRKREGKETDVTIDGVLVPKQKLQKAMTRYGQGTTGEIIQSRLREENNARSPTPDGLKVYTPSALPHFTPPAPTVSIFDLHALPWFRFLHAISPQLRAQNRMFKDLIPIPDHHNQAQWKDLFQSMIPKSASIDRGLLANETMHNMNRASPFETFIFSILLISNRQDIDGNTAYRGEYDDLCHGLVHKLRRRELQPIFEWLIIRHDETIQAISERAFKSSIDIEDIETMTILLKCFKVDPNELLPGPMRFSRPGESIAYTDPTPYLPLELAIKKKNREMVRVLIEQGANVDALGTSKRTMFDHAVEFGTPDIFQDVIHAFPENDQFLFLKAVWQGRFDDVKNMLDQGMDPDTADSFGNTALVMAIKTGNSLVANVLLESGADPEACSSEGLTILQLATFYGYADTTLALLELEVAVEPPDSNFFSTALQFAVHREDYELISILLEHGADINAAYYDFDSHSKPEAKQLIFSPIGYAISSGNVRLCKMLVKGGGSPDDRALSFAFSLGRYRGLIPLLLDAGEPLSEAALFYAAETCDLNKLSLLLEAGADANSTSLIEAHEHQTPLTTAILGPYRWEDQDWNEIEDADLDDADLDDEDSRLHAAKLLVKAGADINDPNATPSALGAAIVRSHFKIVEFLISEGARRDVPSVLTATVRIQDDDLLERLLDEISMTYDLREPSCLCLQALATAIVDQRKNTIQVFQRRHINLSSPCAFMVLHAFCGCMASSTSLAKALLAAGVPTEPSSRLCTDELCDIRSDARSVPLTIFAFRGDEEMVRLLLEYGANPNYLGRSSEGIDYRPALENAAAGGHAKIVDMLLRAGEDVDQLPAHQALGRTALQCAVEHGRSEIIDQLLQAGANLNAPPAPNRGVTALQAAALHGFLGIAVKLLDLGADVNAPGARKEGRTALEGAAEHGRIDMVKLLLQAGADIQSPEFGVGQYNKAVKRARENGHNALARLLENHRTSP